MNRWKEETRKQPECASENVGNNEDSAGSSFGSTQSKRTDSEINLRTDLALKSHFGAENLTISTPRLSMSQKNDAEIAFDVRQDRDNRKRPDLEIGERHFQDRRVPFGSQKENQEEAVSQKLAFDVYHIRDTILAQDAVFREQVRELHRVHGVQTQLMTQMRSRESDLHSSSSGTTIGGLVQPPFDYGVNLARWNGGGPQGSMDEGREASRTLTEPFRREPAVGQRDGDVSWNPQETNVAKRGLQMQPVRRTFDLERSPEDDDEDCQPDQPHEARFVPKGGGMKFIESPVSGRSEPESDTSLNLSSGWAGARDAKEGNREHSNVLDYEKLRATKRTREEEEAPLIPFLATRSENLRDAPTRPSPAGGTQGFLGGLWGLQLGRKLDGSLPADRNSPDAANLPKKERLSLNLEVEEKVPPAPPANCMPHWLLKIPAATPPKKDPEVPTSNFRHAVSSPRSGSDHGPMRPYPPQSRGEYGSGSASGFWDREKHISDNPPRSEPQSSHGTQRMDETDMQAGMKGVYGARFVPGGPNGSVGPGYDSFKLSAGLGEGPHECLALHSTWKEVSELPRNGFSHGAFTPNHAVAGGFGVHVRSFESSASLSGRASPRMNVGIGSATFVPDAASGLWYRPRNLDSQFQRQQQPQDQQMLSLQAEPPSSRHGSWQISQNGGYGQGTVYAIQATSVGQHVGFPVDGLRKVGDELPGSNWAQSAGSGPPFSPFSIVSPPKPPFKRPPKLVLTHDRNTMELKLVSTNGDVAAKVATLERSFSGYSEEELGEYKGTRAANGVLDQAKSTERETSFWARGPREECKRGIMTSSAKDGICPPGGASDWMGVAKVFAGAPHGIPQSGRNGYQSPPTSAAKAQQDGLMDDTDGGSSDVGSGGSGVGDVINPGDRPSPPLGSFPLRGGCNRSLPAGEGEEGVDMGEIGVQADSESQSETVNNSHPSQEMSDRRSQGRLPTTFGYGSDISMGRRKTLQANSGGSDHVVVKKRKHGSSGEELSGESEGVPPVLNPGVNSCTGKKSLHEKDNASHVFRQTQQSFSELRSTQLELQLPTRLTSQANVIRHASNESPSSGDAGKDVSKVVATSPPSGHHGSKGSKEQNEGIAMEVADDAGGRRMAVDQRNANFSNFGNFRQQERGTKAAGHSKKLLGAATSEKSDLEQKPYGATFRRIPSPSSSTVDMDGHAEGSSRNLSQASETVQGNGGSPRRASEWIAPDLVEQDDSCSPGGIDSSCEEQGEQEEEMEGETLVNGLQQDKAIQGEGGSSPETSHSGDLGYETVGTVEHATKPKAEAWGHMYHCTVPFFPWRGEKGTIVVPP